MTSHRASSHRIASQPIAPHRIVRAAGLQQRCSLPCVQGDTLNIFFTLNTISSHR